MPHVELRQLRRSFGPVAALGGIDLSLETGEFVSLLLIGRRGGQRTVRVGIGR